MKSKEWAKYRFDSLWYFVAFSFGIIGYFGLPIEVPFWIYLVLTLCLGMWVFVRKTGWGTLFLFFMLGVSLVSVRTNLIRTEFLTNSYRHKEIQGVVTSSIPTEKGHIVVLDKLQVQGMELPPKRIRFFFKHTDPALSVGDTIAFEGNFYPPRSFQQLRFFYQGIEGQGTITRLLKHQKNEGCFIETIRSKVVERLKKHLTSEQAQIAIPLVVGEQRVVSQDLYAVYRKAGIAHVLSVSGFHMALLASFVFFLVRGLLSCIPFLALRVSSKKVAAVVAFFVTGFYLFVSGMQIPALRAFMMIGLVFLGVLTDRKTFSLYTLFLVGFCLLCIHPEWITSVSFQLSFTAVMVLVGLFDELSRPLKQIQMLRVIGTAILANILISIVLAPFVIYHFNQFNPYSVVGNLLTSLLFSFWVMPFLFIGCACIPIGVDGFFIKVAGLGLEMITSLAQWVAHWPYAEILLPSFHPVGLSIVAFGLCFVCIIKKRWRWCGIVIMLLGLVFGYSMCEIPDIIVTQRGKSILVREEDKFLIHGHASWQINRWLKRNGQVDAEPFSGSLFTKANQKIGLSDSVCDEADLLILQHKKTQCLNKNVFVPKRGQTYFLYISKKGIRIKDADKENMNRPWNLQTKRKEKNE